MSDPNFTLEWRRKPSDDWELMRGHSNTLASVKVWCRHYRKHHPQAEFRIYLDGRLYLTNAVGSGWRIRWLDGNGRTRSEMAGVNVA